MSNVAFLGLGVMGFPMAGHLAKAGHDAVVYNRTAATRRQMGRGVTAAGAPRPAEAAAAAATSSSPASATTTIFGPSASATTAPSRDAAGAIFVDHTTASATVARELAARGAARGLGFIDAPVSGGQAGAENGQLTVMCGGEEADFAGPSRSSRLRAVVPADGPGGAGQLTKMVNQICIAGLVQASPRPSASPRRAGLDPKRSSRSISKGAAQSWQMENRHETMIARKFDFGFAVDWMRKDLAICLDEARRNGASLPVTALVDQFYGEIQVNGRTALRHVEPHRPPDVTASGSVIRDNGTGIPDDVTAKMFNPFFTTKPAGEGTGLGLSLSHDIVVKQHGGTIEVATEPGRFTAFTITLPRRAKT